MLLRLGVDVTIRGGEQSPHPGLTAYQVRAARCRVRRGDAGHRILCQALNVVSTALTTENKRPSVAPAGVSAPPTTAAEIPPAESAGGLFQSLEHTYPNLPCPHHGYREMSWGRENF